MLRSFLFAPYLEILTPILYEAQSLSGKAVALFLEIPMTRCQDWKWSR